MILNQGQQAALTDLLQFILSDRKYYTLEGAGGMGKTTVIAQLEHELFDLNKSLELMHLPTFSKVHYCATTNKAATLLNNARTIHSLLKLKVVPNYKTGRSNLSQMEPVRLTRQIIVIDEASMLSPELLEFLEDSTDNTCKVIFLLDHCQLAPVGEENPTVHTLGYGTSCLTQPMRQDAASHLYQQCMVFRAGVENQTFYAPLAGEGVHILDPEKFMEKILESFRAGISTRVLSYTNQSVEDLNRYIRHKLNGDGEYRIGDTLTLATAKDGSKFTVEGLYTVQAIAKPHFHEKAELEVRALYLTDSQGYSEPHLVPVDKTAYFKRLNQLKRMGSKEGLWAPYFTFLNTISDFRDTYACTVHKSQGSTYTNVFINMEDIAKCKDLNTLVRLCYVAISRAKENAYYYLGG